MTEVTYRHCNQSHELETDFAEIAKNEKRTLLVVVLTSLMMIVEIIAGYLTGSMALLADGYHMASHAGALGISFVVYRLAKSKDLKRKLTFGTGKLLPLGGYTSAIGLALVAIWMATESFLRFLNPVAIEFNEAIFVAVLGLIVNVVSVGILGLEGGHSHHDHDDSHEHEHEDDHHHDHHAHSVHDHNHRSAVLHVLADALTSVTAIAALLAGKFFGASWLDPLIGIVGSMVILKWAYSLCRVTAKELLDFHPQEIAFESVRNALSKEDVVLLDLHAWRSGPSNVICQLIVETKQPRSHEFFKSRLGSGAKNIHLVVEQRTVS